jgi:uncharacterized protein
MPALAARFTKDPALVASHVASHAAYERLAMNSLDETQREFFKSHFMEPEDVSKRKFGNAAVGHEDDLKCMHALVAQSICGASNPLGNLCLHYILHLKSEVDTLLSEEADNAQGLEAAPAAAASATATNATPILTTASPNLKACAVVDRPNGILLFLDRVGLDSVMDPPLVTAAPDQKPMIASAECCAAAALIITACEGHAPRTRKKHRKN